MFHLPNNKLSTVHVHYSIIILCVILSRIGQDTEKTPKHNVNTHLFSSFYVWIQYKYIQQRSASSFWLTMVPVVVFKMTVLSKHWQFTCTWLELTWLETRKNVDWVLLSIFFQNYFQNDGTTANTKPGSDKDCFWVGFRKSHHWLFLSCFRGITMKFSSLLLYHNDSMLG